MGINAELAEPDVETDDGISSDTSEEPVINSALIIGNITEPTVSSTEPIASNTEPIIFGIRCMETDFTGRSTELESLKRFFHPEELLKSTAAARICVVAGTDGIGKTQLVSRFIEENWSSYQNVIWIDSECSRSIDDSFKGLAKQININGGERDAKFLIEEVLNKYCEKNTLFVYDNVETIESIKFGLIRTSSVDGPHVLITSRFQYNDIEVIPLQVWTCDDARKYVSKRLQHSRDIQDDIKSLVDTLERFPLALRLATAYIKNQRISHFVNEYSNCLVFQDDPSEYYQKTFITLTITFEAIQRDEIRGQLATKILNIIAYLTPNGIQEEFFYHLTDDKESVELATSLLINYDMVTFDKHDAKRHLNIHRSIQKFLKYKLQKGNHEELLLKDALKLISELSKHFEIEAIVSHAILVFQYAMNYPSLLNEWSTLPAIVLLKLLKKYRYVEAPSSQELKERIQEIDLQNQLLSLEEQHSNTVTILTVLALQYLSKDVDGNFWKYTVPLAVTGGVVAVALAVGSTVLKQYVERATETAVTKAINKAAQMTEAAVNKAIDETNNKWIGYVATGLTTAAVATIAVVTGVKLQ